MKNFQEFLNELNTDSFVHIRMSERLLTYLYKVKDLKIGKLFLSLLNIEKSKVLENFVDYLNVDDEGNISYIKPNMIETGVDPYQSNKRQKIKVTKFLKSILNSDYLNSEVKQTDIEEFINKWNLLFRSNIEEGVFQWRGPKILDAYNFSGLIDVQKFGMSCANVGNGYYMDPKPEWFDVYVKNPNHISVLVSMENGRVTGRRTLIEGIQVKTHGDFEEGEKYYMLGNFYGEKARGGANDIKIREFAKSLGVKHMLDNIKIDLSKWYGIFRVKIDETKFPKYPPFDSMFVNFELNELSTNVPPRPYIGSWKSTYKAVYQG